MTWGTPMTWESSMSVEFRRLQLGFHRGGEAAALCADTQNRSREGMRGAGSWETMAAMG